MPSPTVHARSLTNGASSTSTEAGGTSTVNGVGREGALKNGTTQEKDKIRSPAAQAATIEQGKQKAKAIMEASGVSPQASTEATSIDRPKSPGPNGVQANGASQTRKRSRDGELIQTAARPEPKNIPPRTKEDNQKLLLEQYVHRWQSHAANIKIHDQMRIESTAAINDEITRVWQPISQVRARQPSQVFGIGWAGYGNGFQDSMGRGPLPIVPFRHKRPLGRKSKELRIMKKDRETQAEQLDELVPIRLDIEHDKYRIRDTFTWNLHDRVVSIQLFAEHLLEDFGIPLPNDPLVDEIMKSMQEQICDFHPHVHMDEPPLDPHLPYIAYKNDDMRVVINLNITIGQHTLVDKFEWEINNPSNSPEEFAQQMTRDLSLSGEFTTAIAHSIREQSQLFTKSLYVTGHPFDGRPIEDHELQSGFCPTPMTSTFRPFQTAKDYTPYLYELNEAELEKTELSLSREERRQKRSVNRRGGPALPDLKDRRRTNRTLLVSTVLPGASENIDDSRLLKTKAAISKKGGRHGVRDLDESDESETEDSMPGSPAVGSHLASGTARTRGIRGAASAAQVAIRSSTLARSATPESMISHNHDTRPSARRVIRDDASSPEPQTSLIVKLKISKQKLQSLLRNQRARTKEMSNTPGPRPPSQSSTPGPSGSMGPPTSTPHHNTSEQSNGHADKSNKTTPSKSSSSNSNAHPTMKHGATSSLGRVDAAGPPGPDHPVPLPPAYLISALQTLQTKYPDDQFEGTMRYTAVSIDTDEPFTLRSDAPPPPNTKYCYYPRIKCKDCPGKLYTPDVTLGVNNFEVHLKNKNHRERVQNRVDAATARNVRPGQTATANSSSSSKQS